jgi:hypothetical protein
LAVEHEEWDTAEVVAVKVGYDNMADVGRVDGGAFHGDD